MSQPALRAAIIGCGQIAGGYDAEAPAEMIRTHVRAYQQNAEVELTSVMDASRARAESFARHWQVPTAYDSLAKLLRVEKPDLVSICTPDAQHVNDLLDCLACSSVKAVWCEKPLALDVAAAEKLVGQAREKNIGLAVNYQRQWEPAHRRLAEEIGTGLWGRVLGGEAVYAKGLFHNGSHLIALLRSLLGEPREMKVHRAFADYSPDDPTVDATLMFGDAPVHIVGLPIPPYAVFELNLFCEAGVVRIIDSGNAIVRQRFSLVQAQLLEPEIQKTELDRVLGRVLENIVQSLREGRPLAVDGESAWRTLKICGELNHQAFLL